MTQPFEDFLADLARSDERSVLDRLDGYMHQHVAPFGQASMIELRRVVAEFQVKAPDTSLARGMSERLKAMAYER